MGEQKDTFSFKVTNFNKEFSRFFNLNDKVEIRRVLNSEVTSTSDLIMVGTIQTAPYDDSFTDTTIRVEGSNYSETIAAALVFLDATDQTIPNAIQLALSSVSNYNTNYAVTWDSGNISTTSTGGAFPNVGERIFYKPLRYLLEQWSKNAKTGDGDYYWYITRNNSLVWKRRDDTQTATFDASTDEYRFLRVEYDNSDIANFAVVKGGVDAENNPIENKAADYSSIGKNGFKFIFVPSISGNAQTLMKQDTLAANVNHMRSASYPFITTWKSLVTEAVVNCASFSAYNTALVAHVRKACEIAGNAAIANRKNGRQNLVVDFAPGTKNWSLSTVVECTVGELDASAKNLRIKQIHYTSTGDTFVLEEDVPRI
jgi:hypothetical protein